MERLTLDEIIKLINKTAIQMELDNCKECSENYKQIVEYLEELKSYKDVEEQGLLVRLPCKVGQPTDCKGCGFYEHCPECFMGAPHHWNPIRKEGEANETEKGNTD